MLTAAENERLTRYGIKTPMGELLRRDWHPIAGSAEVAGAAVRPVRILGEDLVLFRDRQGTLGLVVDRCPHRGAQMRYGIPENEGLRCPYHGRVFSSEGTCLETPSDRAADGAPWNGQIRAYPVEELGGLVFAYLGPEPVPHLPKWEYLVRQDFIKQIGYMRVPCNWLQVAENALDLEHLYWLHVHYANWALDSKGVSDNDPRREQARFFSAFKDCDYDFEAYEHGIMRWYGKSLKHEGDAALKLPVVFPSLAVVVGPGEYTMNFRVPIDDEETLYLSYMCFQPAGVPIPVQDEIPCFEVPVISPDGECLVDFQNGQDAMVWLTQGVIADRQKEILGREDKGVVMLRRMIEEQLERVTAGEDPMNVFREPPEGEYFPFNLGEAPQRSSYTKGAACGPYGPADSPIQAQIDDLFFASVRSIQGL